MSTLFAQLTAAAKPRPPMVKSVTREAVEKRKVTVRAKLKANWSAVFAKLRNRAGTTEIAAQIGRWWTNQTGPGMAASPINSAA